MCGEDICRHNLIFRVVLLNKCTFHFFCICRLILWTKGGPFEAHELVQVVQASSGESVHPSGRRAREKYYVSLKQQKSQVLMKDVSARPPGLSFPCRPFVGLCLSFLFLFFFLRVSVRFFFSFFLMFIFLPFFFHTNKINFFSFFLNVYFPSIFSHQ
jgi:hypothetical protein